MMPILQVRYSGEKKLEDKANNMFRKTNHNPESSDVTMWLTTKMSGLAPKCKRSIQKWKI